LLARKVEVRRLSRSLISISIIAFKLVDLRGALYILIIVVKGVFQACSCKKIKF